VGRYHFRRWFQVWLRLTEASADAIVSYPVRNHLALGGTRFVYASTQSYFQSSRQREKPYAGWVLSRLVAASIQWKDAHFRFDWVVEGMTLCMLRHNLHSAWPGSAENLVQYGFEVDWCLLPFNGRMHILDSCRDAKIGNCVCFDTIFFPDDQAARKTLCGLGLKSIGGCFHSMEGCTFSILAVMPRL
jgi:hypothetical protein